MGGERNRVHLVTAAGVEDWPEMSKAEVAARLVARIAKHFSQKPQPAGLASPHNLPSETTALAAERPRDEKPFRGSLGNIRPTR